MFWKHPLFKQIQLIADVILWNFFLLIFSITVIGDFLSLVSKNSHLFSFYQTLYIFEKVNILPYILNILQTLINILILTPFLCFIYNFKLPYPFLWPTVFFLKIFLDIAGQQHHWLQTKSYFYYQPLYGWLALTAYAVFWIPSYIAAINSIFFKKNLKDAHV